MKKYKTRKSSKQAPTIRVEKLMKKSAAEPMIKAEQPKQVTNQAAFEEYMRLKSNPLLKSGRYQNASDGMIVDLAWFPRTLASKTEHLPDNEQRKYQKLKSAYANLQNKANAIRNKAYAGAVVGDNGETKKSIFAVKSQEIIELFGRMFTIKEVYQVVTKDWRIKCSMEHLSMFRISNIHLIVGKIEEHKRTYSDIRLGHKRSRLEELVWMYMKRKAIYNASGKADDHRLLLATLEQIRKEAEGDTLRIDGNIIHNIDGAVNDLIEKDLTKHLSIKELILARVAAKTNIPVASLIADLSKGWYSKFLNRTAKDAEIEVECPSTQPYDFDYIARVANANEQAAKNQAVIVSSSPLEVKVALDIKAMLLAKLTARKGDVQAEKNDLNPHFIDNANQLR